MHHTHLLGLWSFHGHFSSSFAGLVMKHFLSPLNLAANQTAASERAHMPWSNICWAYRHAYTYVHIPRLCTCRGGKLLHPRGGPSGGAALRITQSHKPTNSHTLTYTHNGDNERILKERVEEKRTMDRNDAVCQESVTIATPHSPPPPLSLSLSLSLSFFLPSLLGLKE